MNSESSVKRLLAENPPLHISGKNRLQNLDALKLMSFVLVLCLHCADKCYTPEQTIWSVTRFIYCLGVIAIPTFFAVSGFQLLGRENVDYRYSVKKILKLLKATFVLYLLVKFLQWVIWDEEFVVSTIPQMFFLSFIGRGNYGLIWFVGALGLIYLCYPLVNRIYIRHKTGFIGLWVALVLFQTFIFTITIVRPSGFFLREDNILQMFRLWNWLGYFCLGGLIKRYALFKKFGKLPYAVILAVICFLLINQAVISRGYWWCEFEYSSIPVILFVTVVFSYVLRFHMDSRFIARIAVTIFPAYMLGDIFLELLFNYMTYLPVTIMAAAHVCLTAACSIASGWLLMQIPVVRNLLRL